jgi:hypothetical protein
MLRTFPLAQADHCNARRLLFSFDKETLSYCLIHVHQKTGIFHWTGLKGENLGNLLLSRMTHYTLQGKTRFSVNNIGINSLGSRYLPFFKTKQNKKEPNKIP